MKWEKKCALLRVSGTLRLARPSLTDQGVVFDPPTCGQGRGGWGRPQLWHPPFFEPNPPVPPPRQPAKKNRPHGPPTPTRLKRHAVQPSALGGRGRLERQLHAVDHQRAADLHVPHRPGQTQGAAGLGGKLSSGGGGSCMGGGFTGSCAAAQPPVTSRPGKGPSRTERPAWEALSRPRTDRWGRSERPGPLGWSRPPWQEQGGVGFQTPGGWGEPPLPVL